MIDVRKTMSRRQLVFKWNFYKGIAQGCSYGEYVQGSTWMLAKDKK